ncbi:MFS transporter [Halalkalicoccus salilacus]|uniref:hypothetical protein n=1 Tax=Halalkalicoccus sp. GCM10025704 TaxID=3252662 RepID=UPI00361845BC
MGALGGATGYLLLAVLPGAVDVRFAHVLAIRVAQGAMTIAAFSLAITMLMDLPGGHGKNMGAAGIAIGLGTASGAPLGGRIAAIDPLLPLWVAGGSCSRSFRCWRWWTTARPIPTGEAPGRSSAGWRGRRRSGFPTRSASSIG